MIWHHTFPNRIRAIHEAVTDKLARRQRRRLARKCARLNASEERSLAEEGIDQDILQWPEY